MMIMKFLEQKIAFLYKKSLLIKDSSINISGSDYMLITSSRRWGKSLNLSMLKYFFGIELDKNGKN